jgi:hypothetical protein
MCLSHKVLFFVGDHWAVYGTNQNIKVPGPTPTLRRMTITNESKVNILLLLTNHHPLLFLRSRILAAK